MDTYGQFYQANKNRLYGYLLRMTGDAQVSLDLVQESFLRYLKRYGEEKANKSLLYTIARNAALDLFRRKTMVPFDADVSKDQSPDAEQQLLDREAWENMLRAIDRLKPLDRELIALVASGDLTYQEIGQVLNISEANVKVRVHRARTRLRQTLAAQQSQ